MSLYSGDGQGFVNGNLRTARFFRPVDMVVDPEDNLHLLEQNNHGIRMISKSGQVTAFAGSGVSGYQDGWISIGCQIQSSYWTVSPKGVVTTLAGDGVAGYRDGPWSTARFKEIKGVAMDSVGNLDVTDRGNNRIRKISPFGMVSTVASSIISPFGIAVDSRDNVYVSCDGGSFSIFMIPTTGLMRRIAGNGVRGNANGINAAFGGLKSMRFDKAGNLFVADLENARAVKLTRIG